MKIIANPYRGSGLTCDALQNVPLPSVDASVATQMLSRCPAAAETELRSAEKLAQQVGVEAVYIKDERDRMGLGSFKALGAAYVIARDAAKGAAKGKTYVTASAGNHGLSVAAGAAAFGANAIIYLSEQVPEAFADTLREHGATVARAGENYEASMEAAAKDADAMGAVLLSDSSWPGYMDLPYYVMEGYTVLMAETIAQMPKPPTHIFLQAGVGGLAGAAAAMARSAWGDGPQIIVVEPEVAPALYGSIQAGQPIATAGPVSDMGRLDCKEPSLIALKCLAQDADHFMLISEHEGASGAETAARFGFATTPSGGAGLAGALFADDQLGMGPESTVLVILSEKALP